MVLKEICDDHHDEVSMQSEPWFMKQISRGVPWKLSVPAG